ncbi:MAG: potassium-transporting ATPase subunit C [Thermoplasmata archaeon]
MTARAPRPPSPLDPIPDETATERPIAPAAHHPFAGHVRASIVLLVLTIFLLGLAYPGVLTVFAQELPFTHGSANGSLIYVNGTAVGSSLIAQNLSAPWLFWERPSSTDYNSFNGSPTLLGYSDPALVNETRAYMAEYGPYAVNASVPEILVTVSGSGLDPDLTPEAALVQIPRIAAATNLSLSLLQALVNRHIVPPLEGFIGPAYVNVLELDLDLVQHYEHRSV